MSGLRILRNRIKSAKSTKKITKAMQIVAAAKLRIAKRDVEELGNFREIADEVKNSISQLDRQEHLKKDEICFFEPHDKLPSLFVLFTSERGLCGGFNSNLVRRVKRDIKEAANNGQKVKLVIVGKKGINSFRSSEFASHITKEMHLQDETKLVFIEQIKGYIMQSFADCQYGACVFYYNFFKNALVQELTAEQVLPLSFDNEEDNSARQEMAVEVDGLVHNFLNLYIAGKISYSMLQSRASEEASRMQAMDSANRNADELIDKLTLKLNRSRQAMITTELTEIISGAEAL